MRKLLIFIVTFFCTLFMHSQDITGEWNGMLEAMQLRIVIHIENLEKTYQATLDSPDQGATGIPVTETIFENNELRLTMENLNASFSGTYDDEKISGTFTQNGFEIPLILQRDAIEKITKNRPQEPSKPYPYTSDEITFQNTEANITLAGTLTLPKSGDIHPAVILISGSGPQDRDETFSDHKPFLVLSDYLTKRGIAVLRFDDRGYGKSTGDFGAATSADFATDVASAVTFLQSRTDIDNSKIGLVGHSEGGIIAPMVASNSNEVAFIVLLAGTGLRGDKLLLKQQQLIGSAMGMSNKQLTNNQEISTEAFQLIIASTDSESLKTDLKESLTSSIAAIPDNELPLGVTKSEKSIANLVNQLASPWMTYFIKHDPAMVLENVKCPILAVNGEKDLQVPSENLNSIKQAALKGGNKRVTTVAFPNLNHLFQECETGAPTEYSIIEQTFAPIALETVTEWILEHTR